jgi:Phosphate-selective porin O and P
MKVEDDIKPSITPNRVLANRGNTKAPVIIRTASKFFGSNKRLLLAFVLSLFAQEVTQADDVSDELQELKARIATLEARENARPAKKSKTSKTFDASEEETDEQQDSDDDESNQPTIRLGDGKFFHSVNDSDDQPGTFEQFLLVQGGHAKEKHWYDKLSIRGYVQERYDKTIEYDKNGAGPQILGDRGISNVEGFSLRRARLVFSGDVADHLGVYIQPDMAITPPGSTDNTFFFQLRDCYGDIYVDKTKVHRFRAGLSKVPYGFENLQSSQNRTALDRSDPINTAVSPNERDLGIFYYYTPEDKQELLKELQNATLKGSGNYGIFGFGFYNGQGGSQLDLNNTEHMVARLTWPWEIFDGQYAEASIQGLTGSYVTVQQALSPNGMGPQITPTANSGGLKDERVCGSFIYYPQPWGFQAEWNVGNGPGLMPDQKTVGVRSLNGGYVQTMYRIETPRAGNVLPYFRYWQYHGPYRNAKNSPVGDATSYDFGIEWQPVKEVEITCEYGLVDRMNTSTVSKDNTLSYKSFSGQIIRVQLQWNY